MLCIKQNCSKQNLAFTLIRLPRKRGGISHFPARLGIWRAALGRRGRGSWSYYSGINSSIPVVAPHLRLVVRRRTFLYCTGELLRWQRKGQRTGTICKKENKMEEDYMKNSSFTGSKEIHNKLWICFWFQKRKEKKKANLPKVMISVGKCKHWKTIWQFASKTSKIFIPFDPLIPLLGSYLEKIIYKQPKIYAQGCWLQQYILWLR